MLKICFLFFIFNTAFATIALHPLLEAASSPVPNARVQAKQVRDLEIKISAEKSVVDSGEPVQLRIEIWDIGTQDVLVCKELISGPCDLRISFDPPAKVEHAGTAGDCAPYESTAHPPSQAEEFANVLVKDWVSIPPKHFYGSTIELDSRNYPELRVPGRYRISGIFSSGGPLNQPCYYKMRGFSKEVAGLPAVSWHGTLETNSVSVRVIGKKN